MPPTRLLSLAGLPLAAVLLSACGTSDTESGAAGGDDDVLEVVVGFYPLEFATARVAGDLAEVETLTSPGVDPHDVELTPQAVATVQGADLVVFSSGLQAAVDDAVADQAPEHHLDVNQAADLIDTGTVDDHDHGHDEEEHADDEQTEETRTEDEQGDVDPHFWLDPQRMADVSEAIADRLAEVDPDNASTYEDNAQKLVDELTALGDAYAEGLASCEQEDMVTTHSAFGYVAVNHGLHQIGITGLTPEAEPSPARLAEVTQIVTETGVDTIYAEVLLGGDIAETVARETGAEVRVLDPLEGITDASPGSDYLEVMQANLETLREGQRCG